MTLMLVLCCSGAPRAEPVRPVATRPGASPGLLEPASGSASAPADLRPAPFDPLRLAETASEPGAVAPATASPASPQPHHEGQAWAIDHRIAAGLLALVGLPVLVLVVADLRHGRRRRSGRRYRFRV